jgi:hypothetical protein
MVVASFHLARFPGALAPTARVPLDRASLRRAAGARFAKLLGTGRGSRMAASADLRRWAVFAVWDDEDALHAFRTEHALPRRWDATAVERYDVTLLPLGAHGTWDGVDPIAGPSARDLVGKGAGSPHRDDRSVAVVTRATVRWRKVPSFLRAVPAVDRTLAGTDGLLATVGIGELPVGRQATFSLWRDAEAVRAFAYQQAEHTDVIRRTRDEGWYGEEWFARFRPTASSGTWDGRDPLA